MNYGIPYMGSKSKICEKICSIFPKADNFYDLFGGGFSITHFMIKHRSYHYKQFHFNEIRPGVCDLIKDAISRKYNYEKYRPEWVSREDFFILKESDPLIKILWSFGNNGKDYLFGKNIEEYKKSMHNAVIFNEFDETAKQILGMEKFKEELSVKDKRLFLRSRIRELNKNTPKGQLQQLQQLEQLERLQRLQQLQQLEQLERLQQLEQLHFYTGSYDQVSIKKNSVIYCDIPYNDTAKYDNNDSFNRSQFLDWADDQINPVFISEYEINDERFKCILNQAKRSIISGNRKKALNKIEKLYVNNSGYRTLLSKK